MTSMNRRDVIGSLAVLGGAAIARPVTALAQQPKRLRVGTANILPKERSGTLPGFEERMAQLGYQQGKNFDLEFVQVPSTGEYGPTYRAIAARKVDIILALGPEIALKSALAVAGSLPIVMIAIDYDPLARGYVPSLARPSGNITGVFFQQIELTTKRLQLMNEALPEMKAVTVFWDRISADQWRAAESALNLMTMTARSRGRARTSAAG
jgi:putative ABC transport system substrate-binding protein